MCVCFVLFSGREEAGDAQFVASGRDRGRYQGHLPHKQETPSAPGGPVPADPSPAGKPRPLGAGWERAPPPTASRDRG